MTPEQKMQKIVEAAGECWHDVKEFAGETMGHYYSQCVKCETHDKVDDDVALSNPSPTDLNELFRLAEKMGFWLSISSRTDMRWAGCLAKDFSTMVQNSWPDDLDIYETAPTPAEALLNALFESVKL